MKENNYYFKTDDVRGSMESPLTFLMYLMRMMYKITKYKKSQNTRNINQIYNFLQIYKAVLW